MKRRVALMGIVHESNTFVESPTDIRRFEEGHWCFGNDIITDYRQAYHEVGGMIQAMEEADIEIVPVMYAEATPGGVVTAAAFETLCAQMFQRLVPSLPIDGCLVVPHGAGVSEQFPDMDGEWLSRLRELVGPDVPVIGTLDPHANLSERMVRATDALIAYRTNPHIDQRQVGLEAGRLMAATLRGEIRPVQRMHKPPLAISIEQQGTEVEPCKSLQDQFRSVEQIPGILSTSLLLGFPYADVPELGTGFLVVADQDPAIAVAALQELTNHVLPRLHDFRGDLKGITELVTHIKEAPRPLLLLDMGDNVGGGSPGDSIYIIEALGEAGIHDGFCCIFDPEAVALAAAREIGSGFELDFGRHPVTGQRLQRSVTLLYKGPGRFQETAPRHGGQVHFDMGKTVILRTSEGLTIMLNTRRTPPFSLRQLTGFGLQPADFGWIVAKGVNAPIAAYRDVCSTYIQVDSPGVTGADMTRFPFRHRRHPLFPFEHPDLEPLPTVRLESVETLADLPWYTEGPVAAADGNMYFTTLSGGSVMRIDPSGTVAEWASGTCPNGQIQMPGGDHLVCDSRDGRVNRYTANGKFVGHYTPSVIANREVRVPNDLCLDRSGYLYFTDSVRHDGRVFGMAPDGGTFMIAEDLDYPNGIVLSEDESILYVAESYANRILAFSLVGPGRVAEQGKRVFSDLPCHPSGEPLGNLPDGIALHPRGWLAVAHYGMGQVQILRADGVLITSLDVGMPLISNLVFIDEHTLMVTGGYAEPGPGAVKRIKITIHA
jgi:microcystin degradation protein MlrC/sugar lactone lactonase YvrE